MRVCSRKDLPANSTRRFQVPLLKGMVEGFLVRRRTRIFAYRNVCPHWGVSLDNDSDDLLTENRRYIICANHGAVFDIATGVCLAGPCVGESLGVLRVKLAGQQIYVEHPQL